MRTEDRDICKECGGFCCNKSGCDYSPKDFKDLGIKALVDILNEGNVSIVAAFDYSLLRDGTKAYPATIYSKVSEKVNTFISYSHHAYVDYPMKVIDGVENPNGTTTINVEATGVSLSQM